MEEFWEEGRSERLSVELSLGMIDEFQSVKREWLLSRLKKSKEVVEAVSWVSRVGLGSRGTTMRSSCSISSSCR